MGIKSLNRNDALALNQKAMAGVDKYFATVDSITLGSKAYTPTSLKAAFQAEDDAGNSADSTRAQLKQQVATHRAARAEAYALRASLRTYLLSVYGKAAVQMLGDFGMVPPKYTGNKTAAVKAAAAARANATRDRHGASSAPQQAATTVTPSQGAQAATPVPVAQASVPARTIATLS